MSDSAPSLVFWLDRLRGGDPAARNELIRHSRDRLRLLTRQMLRRFPCVRQWEETSDVRQNVLLRLDRVSRPSGLLRSRCILCQGKGAKCPREPGQRSVLRCCLSF